MTEIQLSQAVFDTSVIYDAVSFNYFKIKKGQSNYITDVIYKKYKGYEQGRDMYEQLLNTKITEFHTTSHAIGELNGLFSRDGFKKDLSNFTEFIKISIDYLYSKGLNEELIQIIEFRNLPDNYHEIGYVDYGIIKLARKLKKTILTTDAKTLANTARNLSVEVFIPNENFYLP